MQEELLTEFTKTKGDWHWQNRYRYGPRPIPIRPLWLHVAEFRMAVDVKAKGSFVRMLRRAITTTKQTIEVTKKLNNKINFSIFF